jgi:hypothetical protein
MPGDKLRGLCSHPNALLRACLYSDLAGSNPSPRRPSWSRQTNAPKPNTPSKVESQSQTRIYARSLDTTHAGNQNAIKRRKCSPARTDQSARLQSITRQTHLKKSGIQSYRNQFTIPYIYVCNLIHDKPILRRAAYKVTAASLQYHTYSSI